MWIVGLVCLLLLACAGCGPDDLFVNANVGLDSSCKAKADDEHAVPKPVFDIARGPVEASDACDDSFVAQLWVESRRSRRGPLRDFCIDPEC